jgi:hypothetical protein
MIYSDTTNYSGVIQIYEKLIDSGYAYISGDADRLKEATASANNKSSLVWHIIHNITGNWKYDDSNQTDLPFATTDLVLGQRRYALPSEALTVQRIEVKDEDGNWYKLTPITKEQIHEGIDDFLDDNGRPMYYSLVNGVIELYAPTDYSQSDSLKVYYDRGSVAFTTNDTATTPGFASPYHEIIPIMMAIDWYKVKQPQSPTLPQLQQDYLILERNIKEFYGKRFKDYKPKVGRQKVSYK